MPTYEFRCDDCRQIFEERRKMAAADEPVHCPTCGRQARRGPQAGHSFWGCSTYPDCRAIVPLG